MCNCQKTSEIKQSYDNVKKLAKLYSKYEKTLCFIYETKIGYNFIKASCKDAENLLPIEYVQEY